MRPTGWGWATRFALSAEHGNGTDELYVQIRDAMQAQAAELPYEPEADEEEADFDPEVPFEDDPDKPLRVAILGRPNAGKST